MLILENEVSKVTLCEQVADKIEQAILSHGIESDRLPSENALAEQFGVSRTIIRESLKLLKARGLVSSRVGGGAYITKPQPSDISEMLLRIIRMDNISDDEVFSMRIVLEVAAGRSAASRITDEELATMEELVNQMEVNMGNLPQRIDWDIAFHIAMGKYSGNRVLGVIQESLTEVLRYVIQRGIQANGGNEDGVLRHRRILDALRSHDPDRVEEEILDHLERSRQNVLSQMQSKTSVADRE